MSADSNAAWMTYRKEERAFVRTYLFFVGFVFLCCVVSRAPTILSKFSFETIALVLNVGYIVIFAPFVIVAILMWQRWATRHLVEQRKLAAEQRRNESGHCQSQTAPGWGWLGIFLLPALGQFFLLWQFVQEMAPAGTGCSSFEHHRFLWDLSLLEANGFKAIYCFGVTPEQQDAMPYIYPPIQSWLYLILVGFGIWQGWMIWRAWR